MCVSDGLNRRKKKTNIQGTLQPNTEKQSFFFLVFLPMLLESLLFLCAYFRENTFRNLFAFTQVVIYKKGKTLSILYVSSAGV